MKTIPDESYDNPQGSLDVGPLLGYVSTLRIAHWNADTKSNQHKAIGDLYELMDELVDEYVETCLGKHGEQVSASSCEISPTEDSALLDTGVGIVQEQREGLQQGKDDVLLTILADMDGVINKARYLLKTKTAS